MAKSSSLSPELLATTNTLHTSHPPFHLPVTRAIPNQQQHSYRDGDAALDTRVARVSRRLEKSPSATRKPWGWSDETTLHTACRQKQRPGTILEH